MKQHLLRAARLLLDRRWEILAFAATLVFFAPMFLHPGMYGKGDWGYFHFLDAVVRRSILDFGEFPAWNPYYCGGNVLAANTQAHVYAPTMWLSLWLGPPVGVKISALLHGLAGTGGMLLLLRGFGLAGPARFLGTVLFVCSGFFGHQIAGGHVWAYPFYYLPFVLHYFLRGCHEPRFAALAGGFWGLMVIEGGVYPTPYTGLLLGAAAAAMALGWTPQPHRPRARPHLVGLAFLAAGVAFVLVAGFKLLPSLAHMTAQPREVTDYDRIGLGTLLDTFVSRTREWGWERHSHHHYRWWGEYGNYLGWPALVLAVSALLLRFRRVRVPALFLAGTLALTLGTLGPWAPWSLLHQLPVYRNLRVPSRFTVLSGLVIAFLAAVALAEATRVLRERLRGRWTRWVGRLLPGLVAVGVAADVVVLNVHQFTVEFIEPPPPPTEPPAPMRQVRGTFKRMYDHVARNHGTITCQEINSVPRSPRVKEGNGEVGVLPPSAGSATLVRWTPHSVTLDLDLRQEARVWVNQNTHDGWSVSRGFIDPIENQLAARLPPGRHRVVFTYRAPGLVAGAVLTGLGILGIAGWFVAHAVLRRRRAAAGPAPATPADPAAAPPDDSGRLAEPTGDLPPAGAAPDGESATAPDAQADPSAEPPAAPAAPDAEPDAAAADAPTAETPRSESAADAPAEPPAPPADPPPFSRAWWWRRAAPNAAFAAAALALFLGSVMVAEPGDRIWSQQIRDYVGARYEDGDIVQFNPGWVGDPERSFRGLDRSSPNAAVDALESGYRRLWYVFCRQDGDAGKRDKTLGRHRVLSTAEFGLYTVYELGAKTEEPYFFLTDRLGEARASLTPRGAPPKVCRREGGHLACGREPFERIRVTREKAGDQLRRCIWFHPLGERTDLELVFPGLLDDVKPEFEFRYGLTDAAAAIAGGADLTVTLRAGKVRLRRITAPAAPGWFRDTVRVPPGASGDLSVVVSTPRPGARHFCVDAVFHPRTVSREDPFEPRPHPGEAEEAEATSDEAKGPTDPDREDGEAPPPTPGVPGDRVLPIDAAAPLPGDGDESPRPPGTTRIPPPPRDATAPPRGEPDGTPPAPGAAPAPVPRHDAAVPPPAGGRSPRGGDAR